MRGAPLGDPASGAPLGVLMLDTRFPRPVGDIGNPASFAHPVGYKIVRGASPEQVVREGAAGLLQPFINAARELVDEGCTAITTSCGFLVLFQQQLAAALPVPVMTSSLLQIAAIEKHLTPGKRVGVLTIDANSLTRDHLVAAGARVDTPVEGTESGVEFTRGILGNELTLDMERAQQDVVDAALRLTARHPEVAALVLECTNMPPYADAVRRATGLPVYDVLTAIENWRGPLAGATNSVTAVESVKRA